jgi:dUTP pyrophosphatase
MSKIYFKKLHDNAVVPTRGSEFAAGLDLSSVESIVIEPGDRAIVATGLAVIIPNGTYLRIAPRSSLAAKHGIDVLAGVVDSDYRGEIKVILANFGREPFAVMPGERIAQAILEQCVIADVETVEELTDTDRGTAGFGSTGI